MVSTTLPPSRWRVVSPRMSNETTHRYCGIRMCVEYVCVCGVCMCMCVCVYVWSTCVYVCVEYMCVCVCGIQCVCVSEWEGLCLYVMPM